MKNVFDIREYGASSEPGAINTRAIQSAIDACHAAGGGVVYCPPGTFVTGTLWLKSHVTLYLEAGCVLLGSPRRADYEENLPFPESVAFASEKVSDAHLIVAYQAEQVAITGRGRIDGNSAAFLPFLAPDAGGSARSWEWRPGQMLFFCRCRGVRVEGVELVNSPYWTLFFHGCEQVTARGIVIANPDDTPNGDGIDIDCCRDVTVDSCQIRSGDDSITLRGNAKPLGDRPMPCENVTVTNCTLHSACNAIRVGVGSGLVRNCVFSNLVIHDSNVGINVISRYSSASDGVEIRRVRFANVVIDAQMPLYVSAGVEGQAPVADLAFSGITARGTTISYIGGTQNNPVSGLTLRDVDLTVRGGADNGRFNPEFTGCPSWTLRSQGVPCALAIAGAEEVLLQDVRIRWDELEGPWQHALFARGVRDLVLSHVDLSSPPARGEGASAIHCLRCAELLLRGCQAGHGTGRFLSVAESPEEAVVRLLGNDFASAEEAFTCDAPVLEAGNLYARSARLG